MNDHDESYGASIEDWTHLDLMLGLTADLLPVVSNPYAEISPDSKMKALGKTPSRYNRDGLVSGFARWTEYRATIDDVAAWSTEPDYGICIQTRLVRALDIDVPDHLPATQIEDAFRAAFPGVDIPMRTRDNSGKRLLAFTVKGDFPKRYMRVEGGIVELLANGQQFIAAGTHPSGARYEWQGGLPDDFPTFTLDQLDAAWRILAERFAIEAPRDLAGATRKRAERLDVDDPIVDHLFDNGLVLDTGRDGAVYVDCPWQDQHTSDSGPTQTAWFAAGTNGYERGHFKCLHAHCSHRTDSEFKAAIGFDETGFEPVTDAPPPARRKFEAVHAAEFSEGAPLQWLIKGVLPKAALGVLYGASGAGKSFLGLDILAHVAQGKPWHDKRVTKARVVYVVAEGVAGFRKRLHALAKARGLDLRDLDLHVIADAPNLLDEQDGKALAAELSRVEADVVVIDTLAQSTAGANENSSEDMGKALAHCRAINASTGAMVLLVHHSGKDAARGARGWSGLKGACDFEGEVVRDGDDRLFRVSKNKDADDGEEFHFKLKVEVLGVDEDGDDITSCSIEYCDAPPPKAQEAEPPKGANERVLWDVLNEMGAGSDSVRVEDVLNASVERLPPQLDSEGKDRRRRSLRRAVESLISAGRIWRETGEMGLIW